MSLVFARLGAVVDRLLPQFIHPAVVVTSVPVIVVVGTCPVYLALVPRIGAALAIVSCKLMFFAIIISTPWTTAAEPGAAQFFHVFCIGLIMFLSIVHIEAYESHHSIYDLLVPPIIFLSLLCDSMAYFVAIRCGRRNEYGEYIARFPLKDRTQPESEHMV